MPRAKMYPEGRDTLNVVVPKPVKECIQRIASRNRQSASQLTTVILEDWLARRGELPTAEPEAAVVG